MINSVRNTVIAILNKGNYGYFTPSDFNLFAKQAQLDIFEGLFYNYNYYTNKVNARTSGVDYADIKKQIEENIDTFSVNDFLLTYVATNKYLIPTDMFLLNNLFVVANTSTLEKVSHSRINNLVRSVDTAPTLEYPAYTLSGGTVAAYPSSLLNNLGLVSAQYIRYPSDPKWTYVTLSAGEPVFDQGAGDYQDFELSLKFEPKLIVKILSYAGVTIREAAVVQFASGMEQINTQEEK